MHKILKKQYFPVFIIIFLIYILINFYISGFNQTLRLILKYASTVNWLELIISLIFSITIGILVSFNSVLLFIKYKERKKCIEAGAIAGIGAVSGLATGICPLCITGLFPLLFSFFGVTFSFASLPFKGIEIQILITIILTMSLITLNKK